MIRWGGIIIAVSFREEKVYRDLRMMMMIAKKGNKIHLFLLHHRFWHVLRERWDVPATRALRAAGRPMKAEARGLDAATLGATTALAMAFIASTDMIFCFVLKLFLEERAEGRARGQRARAI